MKDRVPAPGLEGRMQLKFEDDGTERYAKVSMADSPSEEGTPLNKSTLLTDETAAALGILEDNPTPEMAFKIIGEKAMPPEGKENWNSGNYPKDSGVWTPKLIGVGSGSTGTYTTVLAAGRWFLQGNKMLLVFRLQLTNITGFSGAVGIGGIPAHATPQVPTSIAFAGGTAQYVIGNTTPKDDISIWGGGNVITIDNIGTATAININGSIEYIIEVMK